MITVWPDWNCIIALEEECDYSPDIRQIRDWYKQGKIALCISNSSRLERAPGKRVYDVEEWGEKLRNVGLEGIEFREARPRPFLDKDGVSHFFIFEEQLLMQEIHKRIFPGVAFMFADYARSRNITMPKPPGIFQAYQESEKLRELSRKWMNKKNDVSWIYTFGMWSGPDDVFVTMDALLLKKRVKLQEPYVISVPALVRVPEDETGGNLEERIITKTFINVVQGHIMSPQEAVEYLRQRLELSS